MTPKSTHAHVVIFAAFFFKFQSPVQVVVDGFQVILQGMCQKDKLLSYNIKNLITTCYFNIYSDQIL